MFRRRRDAPAHLRFPRASRSRRLASPIADEPPKLEFSSQIENGVRGLFAFLGGAARILLRLAAVRGFDRDADATGQLSASVPPYTFLTLSTFIATTAFRALLTTAMVFWLAMSRLFPVETSEPPEYPQVDELLRLPTVEDVIARGIPSVLMVIGVLLLLRWLVARQAPAKAARFFTLTLYIAGFQYLLAAFGVAMMALGLPGFGGLLAWIPYTDVASLVPLAGALAWPAVLYAVQLGKALPPTVRPPARRRAARVLLVACVGMLASLATILPGLVVAHPMAVRELARQAQARPLMTVAVVSDETVAAPVPVRRLTLLVTDTAHRALHLLPTDATLQRGIDARNYLLPARVSSWQGGDALTLTIEPGHSAWVVLETDACPYRGEPDCGMKRGARAASGADPEDETRKIANSLRRWLFIDLSYPTPELASGRVGFMAIATTGERMQILAFVRGRMR